jgi:hypothetical protein
MPDSHELNVLAVVEGVKHVQERRPDYSEYVGHTFLAQELNDRLASF